MWFSPSFGFSNFSYWFTGLPLQKHPLPMGANPLLCGLTWESFMQTGQIKGNKENCREPEGMWFVP